MSNYDPTIVQQSQVAPSIAYAAANIAALQAKAASFLTDGAVYLAQDTGALWRYSAASTLTSESTGIALVATATTAGAGAFLRVDRDIDIARAVTFATADAAILYTVLTGWVLALGVPFQNVTTSWTGGTSSAIGSSSSNTGLSTKGDLLGGASGDVAAGLLSTGAYAKGTVGAKIGKPGAVLVAGDTILFDRITSVFTAGAGTVHFPIKVLVAPA